MKKRKIYRLQRRPSVANTTICIFVLFALKICLYYQYTNAISWHTNIRIEWLSLVSIPFSCIFRKRLKFRNQGTKWQGSNRERERAQTEKRANQWTPNYFKSVKFSTLFRLTEHVYLLTFLLLTPTGFSIDTAFFYLCREKKTIENVSGLSNSVEKEKKGDIENFESFPLWIRFFFVVCFCICSWQT